MLCPSLPRINGALLRREVYTKFHQFPAIHSKRDGILLRLNLLQCRLRSGVQFHLYYINDSSFGFT